MDELHKVVEDLNSLKAAYGIGITFLVILIFIIMYALYKYIGKAAEKAAEEASEENLKKFQTHIDQELVRFQTKHQKQVDAVHEVYQKLQKLIGMINFLVHGQKFTPSGGPLQAKVDHLIQCRHDFANIFGLNRLIFSKTLVLKIDELIPIIDSWIETYQNGLLPPPDRDEEQDEDEEQGYYFGGIWAVDAFDDIEKRMNLVSEEIETEFRKIYGTNE